MLEIVFPSGVRIVCDPGKRRHIAVGGIWDSCCIWGYRMHECEKSPSVMFEDIEGEAGR